jgi:hypothetical protein
MGLLLLVAIATAAVLVVLRARSRWAERRAQTTGGGATPRCGGCGYDTTGLSGLTCPECGADLRAAGILAGQTARAGRGFAPSAVTFVGACVVCGLILASVVSPLLPARMRFEQDVRLAGPRSGAYGAIVVQSTGAWWGEARPTLRVRIELEKLPGSSVTTGRPLLVDPQSGGYEYVDAAGRRVVEASGFGPPAVLAWLAERGIDASDDRVRGEAQAVYVAARRGGRARRVVALMTGGGSSSFTTGMSDQVFNSTRVSELSTATPVQQAMPVLGVLWLAVVACGLVYLWKSTRPGATPMPVP